MTDSIDLRNISNLQQIAETIQKWLQKNDDWKTRFEKYATTLKDKTTENHIKTIRKSFHKVKNLNLYTSIGDINSGKGINLRYKGQSVAYLKIKQNKLILYSNKKLDKTNDTYFGWNKSLNCEWNSPEAAEFRKYFSQDIKKKNQVEHLFESSLIEEFSKKISKDKTLCNIQPVRLCDGQLAFQMPTVLSASGKTVSRSKSARAGGIDILARVKQGGKNNLCVIELKKDFIKNAPQAHIIRGQGLAYAVFLRELLRSDSAKGKKWYEIFGYQSDLPDSLTINVCIAVPKGEYQITSEPQDVHLGQDVLRFKYITFAYDEAKNKITSINSDLFAG